VKECIQGLGIALAIVAGILAIAPVFLWALQQWSEHWLSYWLK
jgi:hypothetical protein